MEIWGGTRNEKKEIDREREREEGDEEEDKVIEHHTETQTLME